MTFRILPVYLALIAMTAACSDSGKTAPERTPRKGAAKVLMIGLDGADWGVMDPMLDAGELPNIGAMIEAGARAKLETIRPTLSPLIWTTVVTGKYPAEHGIKNFWRDMNPGEQAAASDENRMIEQLKGLGYIGGGPASKEQHKILYKSSDRKVKALWNILDAWGLRSDVVSWWVTFPVERINGCMVSDRFTFNRFELEMKNLEGVYERGQDTVWPPEMEERLSSLVVDPRSLGQEALGRFIKGPVEIHSDLIMHEPVDELRIVLAKDQTMHAVAKKLLEDGMPDFFGVYYQGVDISSHYFWKMMHPKQWNERYPKEKVSAEDVHRFGNVIREYYRYADEMIGEILRLADDGTTVFLLSDHGFTMGRRKKEHGRAYETVSGVHSRSAPPGVLVISGRGARRGVRLKSASVIDMTPTVLAVLGLPVARDMKGHVLLSAFEDGAFGFRLPAGYVETFEERDP